jgi:FkbM family methyltransferase
MQVHQIDVVLDVGANVGEYAQQLRTDRFKGRIVSFEPQSAPFRELQRRAAADPRWDCRQLALSDTDGEATMNVSSHTPTSSFLPIKDWLVTELPEVGYVATERARLMRLDSLREELIRPSDRTLLKVDVQGYELNVLQGARRTLSDIALLECELSLVALYEGSPLLRDMLAWLETAGFRLVSVEPTGFFPPSGEVLQVDGIFSRRDHSH